MEELTDEYIINGSGLFHWNSSLSKEEKLEIVKWYNSLMLKEKEYVNNLRHESAMEEYESHCGAEL